MQYCWYLSFLSIFCQMNIVKKIIRRISWQSRLGTIRIRRVLVAWRWQRVGELRQARSLSGGVRRDGREVFGGKSLPSVALIGLIKRQVLSPGNECTRPTLGILNFYVSALVFFPTFIKRIRLTKHPYVWRVWTLVRRSSFFPSHSSSCMECNEILHTV